MVCGRPSDSLAQDPPPNRTKAADKSTKGSLTATALALVPGFLVHGVGHLAKGETDTGYTLMQLEALGLGAMVAAGTYLGAGGAPRIGNEIAIPMLISGSGLFFSTFFADVLGSAGAGSQAKGARRPRMSAYLGYGYVHDPQFEFSHAAIVRGRIQHGRWSTEPGAWNLFGTGGNRFHLPVEFTGWSTDSGERASLQGGVTRLDFGDEGFVNWTPEFLASARVGLHHLGPSLAGSYARFDVGAGYQITRREGASHLGGAILLGGFGYGFYLPNRGELEFYYEHRRDDLAGGLSPGTGQGSGFLGSFGARTLVPITAELALRGELQWGSAAIATFGVEVRKL